MLESVLALGVLLSLGVASYLLGFFKSLRKEFERESSMIETYRSELKETILKLSETHNKLTQTQSDIATRLSAFEMKIRAK